MAFWAEGFWAEGFWAEGFWQTEAPANQSPTDILLSRDWVSAAPGTDVLVGALSAVDADEADTHTFTLVAGTGDTDNDLFTITGSALTCNEPSVAGAGLKSIRVQADDGVSTPFVKVLPITIFENYTEEAIKELMPHMFNRRLDLVYFLAGHAATQAELDAIDELHALGFADGGYCLSVATPTQAARLIYAPDYVMGTVPSRFSHVTVFDPENPPAPIT